MPALEFYAFPEVPAAAVEAGKRIVEAGGIDIGGIEYLESNGERVFHDIDANSNLRPAIAREHVFDVEEARKVLESLLDGPMKFTPIETVTRSRAG